MQIHWSQSRGRIITASHSFQRELTVALQAVQQAAIACRAVQSAINTESHAKQDNSPVTVADYASQALICRQLRDSFPADQVIGEEGAAELRTTESAAFLDRVVMECSSAGATGSADEVCGWIDHGSASHYSPRFWTLDPIDGTKGFLRREQYAIALALIVDGVIEIGVLGCPNLPLPGTEAGTGTLAWAVRGHGAWMQPLIAENRSGVESASADTIHVSKVSNAADFAVCESVESGHSSHDWSGLIATALEIHREPVRMDSQCKYVAVARGDADLYLRLPTKKGYQEKIWDHAAGVLLVTEAGGHVTDIPGASLDWSRGSTLATNTGIVASNGSVHAQILQAVSTSAPAI